MAPPVAEVRATYWVEVKLTVELNLECPQCNPRAKIAVRALPQVIFQAVLFRQ